ncbi:MAG: energy transducer TonB [Saprospiraceae bacterium]|nr:energy transducer TonB [Candidatus Vicinibacter affinis]MBK7303531.1 energy transducer TonB [Candidatus Vicinibacter affinis]MBK7696532.1 energy transducer TonB [Candidatus Vicinibacter affinis]MBK8404928.1 energy transducer TonB [Candidatus Vicinibacter affinis]
MVSNQVIKYAMDDIVFENRNKTYGAYFLRRLYDKNMNRAILIGSVLAILLVSTPMILKALRELMPTDKEDLSLQEIILTDPPPIDPKNPPPPPPPKIDPPPIKDQIKFIPPKVMKDEEVKEEEPPPPTIEEIKDKDISTENRKGEEGGVDASLVEAPPPPVMEEEKKEEEPAKFVEQMPEFPDGAAAMMKYIQSNLNYPAIARENDIQGTVVVQFVVTKSGDITKVTIPRGIGGGCDEEAARVVRSMPNWKPGKHNGKVLSVSFTLPIKFKLEG